MKIGVSFFPSRPKLVIPLAQTADETGFESVWIPEHAVFPTQIETAYPYAEVDPPLPTTPLYDPLIMLTYVAALTQRVKLGTGIYIIPQRHPILVARMLTSVDILSGGRVLFGVGAGWLREEMEALDSDFSTRGPRTDEMIGILRRLWTEPRVAHQGRFYSFPEVGFEPKPVHGTVPSSWEARARLRCVAPHASAMAGSEWGTLQRAPGRPWGACASCARRRGAGAIRWRSPSSPSYRRRWRTSGVTRTRGSIGSVSPTASSQPRIARSRPARRPWSASRTRSSSSSSRRPSQQHQGQGEIVLCMLI